jgi:hypothetical protein
MSFTVEAISYKISDEVHLYQFFYNPINLNDYCDVPSFEVDTSNNDILHDLLDMPQGISENWQRPNDNTRTEEIGKFFSNKNEFLANPIIIGTKDSISDIGFLPVTDDEKFGTLTINKNSTDTEIIFSVVDGQHRLMGFISSGRNDLEVPVILIDGRNNSNTLPKLFSQITTTAKGLEKNHNEWLSYSYQLGLYSPLVHSRDYITHRNSYNLTLQNAREGFKVERQQGRKNVSFFYNHGKCLIKLNDYLDEQVSSAFYMDSLEYKEIFYNELYNKPLGFLQNIPNQSCISAHLNIFFSALKDSAVGKQNHVLFSNRADNRQQIIAVSMLTSFLRVLYNNMFKYKTESIVFLAEVDNNLRTLFDFYSSIINDMNNNNSSEWNFADFTISLSGGTYQKRSKLIAEHIFYSFLMPIEETNVTNILHNPNNTYIKLLQGLDNDFTVDKLFKVDLYSYEVAIYVDDTLVQSYDYNSNSNQHNNIDIPIGDKNSSIRLKIDDKIGNTSSPYEIVVNCQYGNGNYEGKKGVNNDERTIEFKIIDFVTIETLLDIINAADINRLQFDITVKSTIYSNVKEFILCNFIVKIT